MILNEVKIVGVIPVHLASARFPRKALLNIRGIPMVEHVRRRSLLSFNNEDVYIATGDDEISKNLSKYNANIIKTYRDHLNGTSRVAEAIRNIDCTHVLLLQGDEPLLIPSHIDLVKKAINEKPDGDAWNIVGPLNKVEDLNTHSFVKSVIGIDNRIIYCFRKSPLTINFKIAQEFTRKIHGIIAYRKDFLLDLVEMAPSNIEKFESIEQMRIIENGYVLNSVLVDTSTPGINEPHELEIVLKSLENDIVQIKLLEKITCSQQ